jgi:hypothetical protein
VRGRTVVQRQIDRALSRIEKKLSSVEAYTKFLLSLHKSTVRQREVLLRACSAAYAEVAPRETSGRRVAAHRLARLTRAQVDKRWDYSRRHLAHRLAKAIAESYR